MTKRDKVTVDDIIGIVHTDEPTDSVEEVKKLRGRTNERFIVDTAGTLIDMETRNTYDYVSDVVDLLNELADENKELRTKNNAYLQDIEVYREENTQLKLENEKLKSEIKDLNDILARYEEKELQRND